MYSMSALVYEINFIETLASYKYISDVLSALVVDVANLSVSTLERKVWLYAKVRVKSEDEINTLMSKICLEMCNGMYIPINYKLVGANAYSRLDVAKHNEFMDGYRQASYPLDQPSETEPF